MENKDKIDVRENITIRLIPRKPTCRERILKRLRRLIDVLTKR